MEAQDLQGNGTLFIGSKGKMICDAYGGSPSLLPESKMKDYVKPAQTIPRVPENNAYLDWIRACKGGAPACSNFSIAGPYTEWLVLGAIAVRVDGKLEWDAANLRFKNSDKANELVKPIFRKGWEISLT